MWSKGGGNMNVLETLGRCGIVPVVVLDSAEDAVPAARALLAGGIDAMEITFRTAAAPDAIRAVARDCPEMLVGAGTVVTPEQCRQAVDCGAKFIVSPGFDPEVAGWCLEREIAAVPGCVTPTEITAALRLGLRVLKFFPAGVYGGLSAMKALSAPFGGVRFIPTGGVDTRNIGEYLAAPFVHAVGGSWICPKGEIAAGNFARITRLCIEARAAGLGFTVAHLGLNSSGPEDALEVCEQLRRALDFPVREGNSSLFVSDGIEVMKSAGPGAHGHIAISTNSLPMAVAELERRGLRCVPETAKYRGERMTAIYLSGEFGGFAVHLLQK